MGNESFRLVLAPSTNDARSNLEHEVTWTDSLASLPAHFVGAFAKNYLAVRTDGDEFASVLGVEWLDILLIQPFRLTQQFTLVRLVMGFKRCHVVVSPLQV